MKKKKHPLVKLTFIAIISVLGTGCCALCPDCCQFVSVNGAIKTETLNEITDAEQTIELQDSLNQSPFFDFEQHQSFIKSETLTANKVDNNEDNSKSIINKQERSEI